MYILSWHDSPYKAQGNHLPPTCSIAYVFVRVPYGLILLTLQVMHVSEMSLSFIEHHIASKFFVKIAPSGGSVTHCCLVDTGKAQR